MGHMPRMYVAVSFDGGKNKEELDHLCSLVGQAGFEDFCFVRDVQNFKGIRDLMKRALEEVAKSDYFLIDMTDKPTGRAIEAGMAYALGKEVIVIMKKGTAIKDTTRGIASAIIEYETIDEIVPELASSLTRD